MVSLHYPVIVLVISMTTITLFTCPILLDLMPTVLGSSFGFESRTAELLRTAKAHKIGHVECGRLHNVQRIDAML